MTFTRRRPSKPARWRKPRFRSVAATNQLRFVPSRMLLSWRVLFSKSPAARRRNFPRFRPTDHLIFVFSDPGDQQLPYDRKHDGPKEKSGYAIGKRAANDPDQNHQHRGFQSPAHNDGP